MALRRRLAQRMRPILGDLGYWQPEWNTDQSQIRTDMYYQLVV